MLIHSKQKTNKQTNKTKTPHKPPHVTMDMTLAVHCVPVFSIYDDQFNGDRARTAIGVLVNYSLTAFHDSKMKIQKGNVPEEIMGN